LDASIISVTVETPPHSEAPLLVPADKARLLNADGCCPRAADVMTPDSSRFPLLFARHGPGCFEMLSTADSFAPVRTALGMQPGQRFGCRAAQRGATTELLLRRMRRRRLAQRPSMMQL